MVTRRRPRGGHSNGDRRTATGGEGRWKHGLPARTLVFAGWRLDRQAHCLFRQGATGGWTPVAMGSRAMDILVLLLERPGALVSREAIMDAVWPNAAVETNNLTVQISALRHVLDQDRAEASHIQTVPGRGYRFVVPVFLHQEPSRLHPASPMDNNITDHGMAAAVDHRDGSLGAEVGDNKVVTAPAAVAATFSAASQLARRRRGVRVAAMLSVLCLAVGALLLVGFGRNLWHAGPTGRPRLSLVVLPFTNLSGDPKDDYLAEGITDDLTSDLSSIDGAFVIARQSAYFYKGKPVDVRKVGEELGVRYVIEGSVRKIGSTLRINVQLTSAETGEQLWSDRFDEQVSDLAAGQEKIVARISGGLGISVVDIESARIWHEPPSHPDAFDLILRARALENLPHSRQQMDATEPLYQRALSLDPMSVAALTGLGFDLANKALSDDGGAAAENVPLAKGLLMRARAIAPYSEEVLNLAANLLHVEGRWQEGVSVARELIRRYPNTDTGYFELAQALIAIGQAEEPSHSKKRRSSLTRSARGCSHVIETSAAPRCCWARTRTRSPSPSDRSHSTQTISAYTRRLTVALPRPMHEAGRYRRRSAHSPKRTIWSPMKRSAPIGLALR